MSATFTGRHAALVIGGGFLVVIAVNLTLAVVATRSHPGLVVENSYVASQKFNGWLAQGRAQKALGWTIAPLADRSTLTLEATDLRGAPLQGLKAMATLSHPLGAEPPRDLVLVETAPGRYAAPHGLAPGQWIVEARLQRGSEKYYLNDRLVVPR
jgi:nitrogen fixation protein FixH